MMKRRDFITLLGGAAATWPVAARAQQRTVPVVGWLDSRAAAVALGQVEAFRQGLREAGFAEGRNVAIEFKWADDRPERLRELAADLVRRQVAVIAAISGPAATAAKAATSTIPIVFNSGADPVNNRLVADLNRPGGNVTGVSMIMDTLNPKRFELLHDLVPKPAVIGVLWYSTGPNADNLVETQAAARTLARQILVIKIAAESEFDDAFTKLADARVGGLFVGTSPFFQSQSRRLVTQAARLALPACYHVREFVALGGLMSYGASTSDSFRRAGVYVGRVLEGEKPGDLPIELPKRYELVFNLATAKALKIEIPAKLLALADEVIE